MTTPVVAFAKAAKDVTGGNRKVQRKHYLRAGALPVIDQGQSEIAGYTDDPGTAYTGELPVVLFGDHTRALKYVDHPFALGADGVKVLEPRNGFCAKFLYYYWLSIDLPSHGYSRHFKYLKDIVVPVFSPSEQHRIVTILDQADALRQQRRAADAKAARILPALFLKMFGDPRENPFGLEKKPLGELIKVRSGKFLAAKDMAVAGAFPVYGGNGVNGHHDEYMFGESKIVLGRVGAYCGAVHYAEPRSWITDNALYVSEKLQPLADRYLVAALRQADLNQYAGRAGQPLISGNRIYPVEILRPPQDAQLEFAKIADRTIKLGAGLSSAATQLRSLQGELMRRAFSGQLTAKWREARMNELLAEIREQARLLDLPVPDASAACEDGNMTTR